MGMSTSVIGLVDPTPEYEAKVKAYRACEAAGIEVPDELQAFFHYDRPCDDGMKVELGIAAKQWSDEFKDGFDVDLSKLPKGVTRIRFFNSW